MKLKGIRIKNIACFIKYSQIHCALPIGITYENAFNRIHFEFELLSITISLVYYKKKIHDNLKGVEII